MVDIQLKLNMKLISEQIKQQQKQHDKKEQQGGKKVAREEELVPPPRQIPDYNRKLVPIDQIDFGNLFQDSVAPPSEEVNFQWVRKEVYYCMEPTAHRFQIEQRRVPWSVGLREPEEYDPIHYISEQTRDNVQEPSDRPNRYADDLDEDNLKGIDWNSLRPSYHGEYRLNKSNAPLNPVGRTGVCHLGELGQWGPNYTNFQIITRWAVDSEGQREFQRKTRKPYLQFLVRKSRSGGLKLPGGFCSRGQWLSNEVNELYDVSNQLYVSNCAHLVYKGYVDDRRNTDNAWIETVIFNMHDENGNVFNKPVDRTKSDLKWMNMGHEIKLYANHQEFLEMVAKHYNAHW